MRKGCGPYRMAVVVVSALLGASLLAHAAATPAEPGLLAGERCGAVENRDVHALIAAPDDDVFSVDTRSGEAGQLSCVWFAQKTAASDGAPPDAVLTLDLYRFASVTRARAKLRGFAVPPQGPQRARTDDAHDEVVQLAPVVMAARHGADVAVARASVPESIRRRPDWGMRFEALTLAGAGARVLAPRPLAGADAARLPAPASASTSTSASVSASATWLPAARPVPSGSALWTPVVHVMWRLARWRFEFVAVAMLSVFLIAAVGVRLRRGAILLPVPLLVGYAFLNLAWGPDWGVALIDRFGVQAPAVVTGTFATADVYNDRNVVGYRVLIRPPGGPVVETTFESDDFNVYPPRNATRYPDSGDVFTVRYLRGHPDDFVIVSNDGSPWSARLRCEALAATAAQADRKARFAPDDAAFAQAAQAARRALQTAGCTEQDGAD